MGKQREHIRIIKGKRVVINPGIKGKPIKPKAKTEKELESEIAHARMRGNIELEVLLLKKLSELKKKKTEKFVPPLQRKPEEEFTTPPKVRELNQQYKSGLKRLQKLKNEIGDGWKTDPRYVKEREKNLEINRKANELKREFQQKKGVGEFGKPKEEDEFNIRSFMDKLVKDPTPSMFSRAGKSFFKMGKAEIDTRIKLVKDNWKSLVNLLGSKTMESISRGLDLNKIANNRLILSAIFSYLHKIRVKKEEEKPKTAPEKAKEAFKKAAEEKEVIKKGLAKKAAEVEKRQAKKKQVTLDRPQLAKQIADLTTQIRAAKKAGKTAEEALLLKKRIKLRQKAKKVKKMKKMNLNLNEKQIDIIKVINFRSYDRLTEKKGIDYAKNRFYEIYGEDTFPEHTFEEVIEIAKRYRNFDLSDDSYSEEEKKIFSKWF